MPILDIETKPRPDLVRRFIKPFPPFDPKGVKYGNTKDPEKRAVILAEKERDHAQEESDYWAKATERAALNPLTAELLCIGLLEEDGSPDVMEGDEVEILKAFWKDYSSPQRGAEPFIFWSGCGSPYENFDPEFIIKRSWIRGVKVPPTAHGRLRFVDGATMYLMGRREAFCSLTDAGEQLGLFDLHPGIRRKDKATDRITGANVWQWWTGTMPDVPETPEQQHVMARAYLVNDLCILDFIWKRIS